MPIKWKGSLKDGSLKYRELSPADPVISELCFEDEESTQDVTTYVQSRGWFKKKSRPPAYIVGHDSEPAVGFVKVGFKKERNSEDDAVVLIVYVIGVTTPYQGKSNPYSPSNERWSASFMRLIEEVMCASRPNCIGIQLRVKAINKRAIAYYRKTGFMVVSCEGDSKGVEGEVFTMRKVFT